MVYVCFQIFAHFEFNNVKCVARDPKFMVFEYCFLRSVNRTYKYFSLKSRFFKYPIDNTVVKVFKSIGPNLYLIILLILQVSIKLFKRENKHIFDKYNVTIDGCKYLKQRANPLANILFGIFGEYSNLNHTCPYNVSILFNE